MKQQKSHPQTKSLKIHYYNTEKTKSYLNLLTKNHYEINNQNLTKILTTLESLREEGIAKFKDNDPKQDKIIIIPKRSENNYHLEKNSRNNSNNKNRLYKEQNQQPISIDEVDIVQTEGMI